ncbi:hypothetical protein [Mediterraneibacter sp. ICN-202921]|uniref:hypothetical protein n=1 Tax=Mediterraneibacter sp. ICN-202921 TaxID=3134657 RepID=UPI0030C31FF4
MRPESETVPARKKRNGNQEKARDMAARGMKAPEIAKELGLKYNTVYYYLHPEKCSRKKTKAVKPDEKIATGWNADRHACKSCQYRAEKKGCDYYLITDKERGCDPADCDKYVEGK